MQIEKTLTKLLSDDQRPTKILIALLFITMLGIYAVTTGPDSEVTFNEIEQNPAAFKNQELNFGGRIKERSESNQTVTLLDRGFMIRAENIGTEIPIGQSVSGIAKVKLIDNQPILLVSEYHYHTGRDIKILSGPIVIGILTLWFFTQYRFDFSKKLFVKKKRATTYPN